MDTTTTTIPLDNPYYLISIGTYKGIDDDIGEGSHGEFKVYSEQHALEIMRKLFPDEEGQFVLDTPYSGVYLDEAGVKVEYTLLVKYVEEETVLVDVNFPSDAFAIGSDELGWCGEGCLCYPEPDEGITNEDADELNAVLDEFNRVLAQGLKDIVNEGVVSHATQQDLVEVEKKLKELRVKYE